MSEVLFEREIAPDFLEICYEEKFYFQTLPLAAISLIPAFKWIADSSSENFRLREQALPALVVERVITTYNNSWHVEYLLMDGYHRFGYLRSIGAKKALFAVYT